MIRDIVLKKYESLRQQILNGDFVDAFVDLNFYIKGKVISLKITLEFDDPYDEKFVYYTHTVELEPVSSNYGLTLDDPCIEHDCITGILKFKGG